MSLKAAIANSLPNPVKAGLKNFVSRLKGDYVNFEFRKSSSLSAEDFKFWEDNGFLLLPKFFSTERLGKVNNLVEEIWENKEQNDKNPLVVDIFVGNENGKRIFIKNAPSDAKKVPYKLNDLFLEFDEVKSLSLDAELCKILNDLLEGEPMVCNTLNFERGSQQDLHFDTFYMPPRVQNKMVATWIALEDCSLDAGPLIYYPASHKIPPYYFSNGLLSAIEEEMPQCDAYIQEQIKQYNLEPKEFSARAGDVFIWHAQLLHGGGKINDMSLTRKSLVTHYFRINEHPNEYLTIGDFRHYQNRSHQKVDSK